MHDGGANTFQFANPMGREAQVIDRNDVKELLQQLLPKFKRKVNSELEEKHRCLFIYLFNIIFSRIKKRKDMPK